MEEHNNPFAPVTPSDARNIVLHAVGHSFEATGDALEWTISGPDGLLERCKTSSPLCGQSSQALTLHISRIEIS
jgi:hypothetical protein